jgi:chloramphenicol-sensitive protein RarD
MKKNIGNIFALGAYISWAVFPIYWKMLGGIDPLQLSSHRIIWSFLLLLLFLFITKQSKDFLSQAWNFEMIKMYSLAGVLLATNWSIYVYAVTSGHIVETSLGYFINPLVSVLLGVVFLHEKMRPFQWLAALFAAIGVIYLTITVGTIPYIALGLALSFGMYGFLKKRSMLNSTFGLTLETGVLFIPALFYILYSETTGNPSFGTSSINFRLLLIGGGLVTTIPLIMFAQAAKLIPLSHLGFFQYVTPTVTFLLGVYLYGEPFDHTHLIGFGLVWFGLLIFIVESVTVLLQKKES